MKKPTNTTQIIHKSPLALSIMLAISGVGVTYAEDVSCTNTSNCVLYTVSGRQYLSPTPTTNTQATKSLSGNTVTLDWTGGVQPTIDHLYGGYSKSNATAVNNNTVVFKNGKVHQTVIGGYNNGGSANGNTVIMSGGNTFIVAGGEGRSGANNNTVNISGIARITHVVYGGQSLSGNTNGNTVNIGGNARIGGDVYGGDPSSNKYATGNTVTITGNPTFGTNTQIWGGANFSSTDFNRLVKGNTLNYAGQPISIWEVNNFEHYNFFIGKAHFANVVNGTTAMITTTSSSSIASNITNSDYSVGFEGGTPNLNSGDRVTLLSNTTGFNANAANGIAKQGIARIYDVRFGSSYSHGLSAIIQSDARVNPQSKALLESALASNSLVNRGADLVANDGIDALAANQGTGMVAFGATSAGKNRTETGSHIEVSGAEFLLGVGKDFNTSVGSINVGGFAEFGFGSYDAFNDFANMPDVRSSGNTHYYGLGIMAQQDFESGLYLKGSISTGLTDTDFNSTDLVSGFSGTPTSFDSQRNYFSSFAGVGYEMPLAEDSNIDIYGNLNYTYLGDDDQTIAGDRFHFDAVHSVRSTLGARWTKALSKNSSIYAGAAWEHEFDGTASGSVNNMAIANPSLGGNTGLINIGYRKQTSDNLTFDIGAQGSFGNRRGASINATLDYKF